MKADAVCSKFGVDPLKTLIDRCSPPLAICKWPSAHLVANLLTWVAIISAYFDLFLWDLLRCDRICQYGTARVISFFDDLVKFGSLLEFNLFRGLRLALGCSSLAATMLDADSITELQTQLTHLERHIAEQDAEFYQLAKRLDALSQLVQLQKTQINTLSSGGQAGAEEMPANEKPPHY